MFFPDDPATGRLARDPAGDRWARMSSHELEAMIRRERAQVIAAGLRRGVMAAVRAVARLFGAKLGESVGAMEYPAAAARWLVDNEGAGDGRRPAANAPPASRDVA